MADCQLAGIYRLLNTYAATKLVSLNFLCSQMPTKASLCGMNNFHLDQNCLCCRPCQQAMMLLDRYLLKDESMASFKDAALLVNELTQDAQLELYKSWQKELAGLRR